MSTEAQLVTARSPVQCRTGGLVTALACAVVTSVCSGAPLVTILCEPMTGTSRTYGVEQDQPQSGKHLGSFSTDRLNPLTMFVVAEDGRSVTLIYGQPNAMSRVLLEDAAKQPKPEGRVIPVLSLSRDVMTVVDSHAGKDGATTVYSLYPKLGALFMSQHYLDLQGEIAREAAMFAKCEFKWNDAR